MTTSTTPKICACGKPCKFWKGEGSIPSFYAVTCGDAACVARDEKARAVPKNDYQVDPAESAKWEQDRAEALESAKLARFGCPIDFRRLTVGDFDGVDVPAKPCNLLLSGPNGTGKSALSVALMRLWGLSGCWSSAYRILSRIKSTFRKHSDESEVDVMDEMAGVGLLVIDDLGAQHNTEFGLATIYEIIKERCENYRPTIVTTNLTFTEIDKVEPRLASRLAAFRVIKLVGKDRRLG